MSQDENGVSGTSMLKRTKEPMNMLGCDSLHLVQSCQLPKVSKQYESMRLCSQQTAEKCELDVFCSSSLIMKAVNITCVACLF